jgi:Flp pilus assembly CpaE family ATPase
MAGIDEHPDYISSRAELPVLRVAIGLGNAERERALLSTLGENGDLVIVDRCLSVDQLMSLVRLSEVDVVLVGDTLHRLNSATAMALARSPVPVVLLADPNGDSPWSEILGSALPWDADAGLVQRAVIDAFVAGRPQAHHTSSHRDRARHTELAASMEDPPTGRVIVVAGGHGSPGRTTVALNLATTLGTNASTVIIDADLCGPSIAAYVDADPTRNLSVLAQANTSRVGELDDALAQEIQPLAWSDFTCSLICGVPKSVPKTAVSAGFVERLIDHLQRRYQYVIIDIGADLVGTTAGVHQRAVWRADQVLFVAGADLVSLWQARTELDIMISGLSLDPDHIALVINRHDRRRHHRVPEIEWALGVRANAIIPFDYPHIQRALAAQQPLVLDRHSPAGRALRDLAAHVHRGRVVAPHAQDEIGRVRLSFRRLTNGRMRSRLSTAKD